MIRDARWQYGFITGTVFLAWSIILSKVLIYYLSLGFGLLFVSSTVVAVFLITVLMLLFAFFKQLRPISFGLALPFLIIQIGLFIYIRDFRYDLWRSLFINAPGWIALFIVGIFYLKDRWSNGQLSAVS